MVRSATSGWALVAFAAAVIVAATPVLGAVHVVDQFGNTFVPDQIEVAPGDLVRWIWHDGFHTVTSGTNCKPDNVHFNAPLFSGSPEFEYAVPADFEGELAYYCAPHCGLGMVANITVEVACVQDLDGSGSVDFGDLLRVLAAWGPCDACPEDLDGSGQVEFGDVLEVLGAWGPCP